MKSRKRDFAEIPPESDQMLNLAADPKVFASNLDRLTQMNNLTRKEVANLIGANYQWYRRIVTKGLVRIQQDHRVDLAKLVRLFGLNRVEDLWRADLILFRVNTVGLSPQADPREELAWYHDKLVPYAKKLGRLLATGKHEYLKELIDRLHATLPKEEAAS